jgi:hypothetical protein
MDAELDYHQSELLFAAYGETIITATLVLVRQAGHTGAYLYAEHASRGRTVLHTGRRGTTRGCSPGPPYAILLSFVRDNLDA